jgi:hypothetical protein
MNKHAQLRKDIIKTSVICGLVIAGFAGAYFGTSAMGESADAQKSDAEKVLTQDRARISDLTSQLDKSGIAEKRYLETQENRTTLDYESNSDTLKEWLKKAITQYRLSNSFKLSLTPDQVVDNKALNGTNYEAIEHVGMKIEYSSITDTHSFSFLQELMNNAPGFVVIENLSMKRIADVDKNVINLLQSGASPYLVETKITFNWIGLHEKVTKKPDGTGGK